MVINTSLNFVKDRVIDELKEQLTDLQQYTRRYSAVVSGLKMTRSADELKSKVEEVVQELYSKFEDVDKFHWVGLVKKDQQDMVIRFKSHSAKENFYIKRKQIRNKNIKIKPSLAPARRELLYDARDVINDYEDMKQKMTNPPHFVYADVHGNLKLKMTHAIKNRLLLFKFRSINELNDLIMKNQNDMVPNQNDGDQ